MPDLAGARLAELDHSPTRSEPGRGKVWGRGWPLASSVISPQQPLARAQTPRRRRKRLLRLNINRDDTSLPLGEMMSLILVIQSSLMHPP